MEISINQEQKLYVLASGDGVSCFGFDNARDHAAKIGRALKRDDLLPLDGEYGTVEGYAKYRRALAAWGDSVFSRQTYFDPGTPDKVARLLERYRTNGKLLRLFLGNPQTGRDWGEESDVVGYIGRSGGTCEVPLLLPPSDCGGPAISTASVIRLMDVETSTELYRAPTYETPELSLHPCSDVKGYLWEARRDGKLAARFSDLHEAAEWCAFIRGDIAARREDLAHALQRRHAA
jgi:hypothetical protein